MKPETLRTVVLDTCILGGVLMLGMGLWMERPSLALAVVGVLLLSIGIWSASRT